MIIIPDADKAHRFFKDIFCPIAKAKGVTGILCTGAIPILDQVSVMRNKAVIKHVIIGTPERVYYLLPRFISK